mmetsp:Transcript_30699/g.65008  ORF Transcript_30699/g.65008 Transcript_30699/m.65008 type:complete len:84 (-) Transcript_30699:29-280(-)
MQPIWRLILMRLARSEGLILETVSLRPGAQAQVDWGVSTLNMSVAWVTTAEVGDYICNGRASVVGWHVVIVESNPIQRQEAHN